jgi:hypothetical protein
LIPPCDPGQLRQAPDSIKDSRLPLIPVGYLAILPGVEIIRPVDGERYYRRLYPSHAKEKDISSCDDSI